MVGVAYERALLILSDRSCCLNAEMVIFSDFGNTDEVCIAVQDEDDELERDGALIDMPSEEDGEYLYFSPATTKSEPCNETSQRRDISALQLRFLLC